MDQKRKKKEFCFHFRFFRPYDETEKYKIFTDTLTARRLKANFRIWIKKLDFFLIFQHLSYVSMKNAKVVQKKEAVRARLWQ